MKLATRRRLVRMFEATLVAVLIGWATRTYAQSLPLAYDLADGWAKNEAQRLSDEVVPSEDSKTFKKLVVERRAWEDSAGDGDFRDKIEYRYGPTWKLYSAKFRRDVLETKVLEWSLKHIDLEQKWMDEYYKTHKRPKPKDNSEIPF